MACLTGKGEALTLVAKELALDLAQCEYMPKTISHLPGVANVMADVLSRKFDPAKSNWAIPHLLRGIPPAEVAPRDESWWKVISYEKAFYSRRANRE